MARAIDADDLKRTVESFAGVLSPGGSFLVRQDAVLRAIELAPVIDTVKRGENLKGDYPSLFECSECGWECWDTMSGDTVVWNYCPNCGVKMNTKEEEQA